MKKGLLAAAVCVLAFGAGSAHAAATCTPTGLVRDGIDLTAALVDPGTVTGTVDATGCNIGVYYGPGTRGKVSRAEIFGANYYGVANDGGSVDVSRSSIHDIGESPLNGTQHGVAIYFVYGSAATGSLTGNDISNYQKGGIVVNGVGSSASIVGNTVTGQGPVGYIAQNGIQIGYGATASVVNNRVTGNAYTGTSTVSGGIIVVGGPGYGDAYTTGVNIVGNTVLGNDVGIFLTNIAADGSAPTDVKTSIKVVANTVEDDAVTNGYGYQAGISDVGNGDFIVANRVSGVGYTPVPGDSPYLRFIDADPSFTNGAHVLANRIG